MASKNTSSTVTNLLQGAQQDGVLSPESVKVLAIADMGAQIQAGLGISVDDVPASEVLLVTVMPDDSGSIADSGNEQAVRDGHNLVLDALEASKQKDSILAHTRYLNGNVLFPYCPLPQAQRMTAQNYRADGRTPLYDQAVVLLGTVLAKTQEFTQTGVVCRTVTLIITDGADYRSTKSTATDVAALVRDIDRGEGTHIVAAMGIADGHTHFRDVFKAMGIKDKWILTPGNNASDIRKAFEVFSQSAVRASQAAAAFSQTSAGGFAAP